jgi:hypothetical protein
MMPVDPRDAWVRAYLGDVFNGHNVQSLDKYMSVRLVVSPIPSSKLCKSILVSVFDSCFATSL